MSRSRNWQGELKQVHLILAK